MLTTKDRRSLVPKRVSCPILFCYGTNKNVMFHKTSFLRDIDARVQTDGRSKHYAIEGAGHWLQTRGEAAKKCCEAIDTFLSPTTPARD